MRFEFTVKTSKEIVDKAFRRGRSIKYGGKNIDSIKEGVINKISTVENVVCGELKDIVVSMPSYEKMSSFYKELFSSYVDVRKYKRCLYHISWTERKIREITRKSRSKIKGLREKRKVLEEMKNVYGRVSSLVGDLEECLNYLIFVSKTLRKFPEIEEDKAIFVVGGYPNVGKSSLIKAITGSHIRTEPYPFTTKDILIGKGDMFLLIDTPGILEKNLEELNEIEIKGLIALKHLSKHFIFVIDPTMHAGYSIEDQLSLLEQIRKKLGIEDVYVVINKIDLLQQNIDIALSNVKRTFYVSTHTLEGIKELKEFLEKEAYRVLSKSIESKRAKV